MKWLLLLILTAACGGAECPSVSVVADHMLVDCADCGTVATRLIKPYSCEALLGMCYDKCAGR